MEENSDLVNESVNAVKRISVVPAILEIICRATGLGFAAVARVTPERWIACEVRDEIKFGLKSGGELKVDTTICHEIRQSGIEVLIDDVKNDEFYCFHHTPALYGFRSYISVPIWLSDGSFFGTLCAIDAGPALLKNTLIRELFKIYASLISFLIDTDKMQEDEARKLKERCVMALRAYLIRMTELKMDKQSDVLSRKSKDLFYQNLQEEISTLRQLIHSLKESMEVVG